MKNNLLKFKTKLEDPKNKFNLSYASPCTIYNWALIELDNEDLEYFKRKYLPKLRDEMENNLKEIKDKYKDVL